MHLYSAALTNQNRISNSFLMSKINFPWDYTSMSLFLKCERNQRLFLFVLYLAKIFCRSIIRSSSIPLMKNTQNIHNKNHTRKYIWNIIFSISLNRELELIAGDYVEQPLQPDTRLWTLCQSAALNRTALQPGAMAFVATHT